MLKPYSDLYLLLFLLNVAHMKPTRDTKITILYSIRSANGQKLCRVVRKKPKISRPLWF